MWERFDCMHGENLKVSPGQIGMFLKCNMGLANMYIRYLCYVFWVRYEFEPYLTWGEGVYELCLSNDSSNVTNTFS